MEFKIDANILKRNILLACSAIAANPILPILKDLLFVANEDGRVKISGTNLETHVITETEAEVIKAGSCTIEADKLKKWVSTIDDAVGNEITINYDGERVYLVAGSGSYGLPTQKGKEYPATPEIGAQNVRHIEIMSQDLIQCINRTSASVCTDTMRPNLTGICFDFQDFDGEMVAVSTDSFIMTKTQVELVRNSTHGICKPKVIIPKAVLSLVKGQAAYLEEIKFSINEKNIFFELGSTRLICRLSDYDFPDYEAIFPKDSTVTVTCDRKGLINAFKRAGLFANQVTNASLCVFDQDAQTLFIHSEDKQFQTKAVENFEINVNGVDGKDFRIGLNAAYMIKQLTALSSERVLLEMSSHTKPVLILQYEFEEQTTALIMPNFSVQLHQETLKKEALNEI